VFPLAINQALTDSQKYRGIQRPSKRLLSKIYAFREEVNIVKKAMLQQYERYWEYVTILEPRTFRITNNTRKSMYDHEVGYWNHILWHDSMGQIERMEALEDRIETLVKETNQQVDILEEDHGKAILVFTIITIIFLPLSFVTGLLGMNTVDLENTIGGQWHFWAIALPVSAIVVALSLLIGYRSDDFLQFLEKRISKPKSRNMVGVALLDQYDEPDEESNVSADEKTAERVKPKYRNRHRKAKKVGPSVGGDNV
jgi:Mg2+ and Co2+ transporter CorA